MLTLAQKTLVQDTFAIITPIADDAAALFYQRLFELDPSLERMFRGDMKEQRKKVMQMLTAAVKGLDRLDQLVPVVEDQKRGVSLKKASASRYSKPRRRAKPGS